jgi:hypothetical protein
MPRREPARITAHRIRTAVVTAVAVVAAADAGRDPRMQQ